MFTFFTKKIPIRNRNSESSKEIKKDGTPGSDHETRN